MKRKGRVLLFVVLLLVPVLLGGCCGWRADRWWEAGGKDCAPCGDPCDACDTRG